MNLLKYKYELAVETILTTLRTVRKKIAWTRQGKDFKNFGELSVFEKPLYVRKLQYVSVGKQVLIKQGSKIQCDDLFCGAHFTPSLIIEDKVYIGNFFTVFVYGKISIGTETIIGDHVMMSSENHGTNVESNLPYASQPLTIGDISIGRGCWIGYNVTILPGVSIGDKVIIGAGSVVTRDIPSFSMAVGNPARVIKQWSFEKHSWERSD